MRGKYTLIGCVASLLVLVSTNLFACKTPYFGSAEYLYWGVEQQGMPYGVVVNSLNNFPGNGRELRPQFDWGSGFRLGLGGPCPCLSVDASVYWTRFHHRVANSCNTPIIIGTEVLGITDILLGGEGFGGPASQNWQLKFDMLDVQIGTWCLGNCAFALHPYLGIKGGWIRQQQAVIYENFLFPNAASFINARILETNNFSGIGPKLGFNSAYRIWENLSLVGEFASSLMYGLLKAPIQTALNSSSGAAIFQTFSYRTHRLIPTLQLALGINWEACICKGYSFGLGLAYESQMFWDAWRHQNSSVQNIYITDAGHGPLMFQGLTARFALMF